MTAEPPGLFLGALTLQLGLHLLLPGPALVPPGAHAAGVLVILLGVALHHRAWRHFRARGTPLATLAEPDELVTDGPFAWSRNPMYLAGIVVLAGAALLYGTTTPWVVAPGFALVSARLWIVPEERLLEGRFGRAYADYRRRVGRWVGGPGGPASPGPPEADGASP